MATNKLLSYNDVMITRAIIAENIVKNLRKYGDIVANSNVGMPYNFASNHEFSAGNYLRYAASTYIKQYENLRWVSQSDIQKNKLELNIDAKPLLIEYWSKNGARLLPFYNLEDITSIPEKEYDTVVASNDLSYAKSIISELDEKVPSDNILEIFDSVKKYSSKHGCDDIGSSLAANMFLKKCNLAMDYKKKPLFSEEIIAEIEADNKIIFQGAKQASKVLKDIFSRDISKTVNNMPNKEINIDDEFCKLLKIHFNWSEYPISDFDGNVYKENTDLSGEKAYEFLSQMIYQDKLKSNGQVAKTDGYYKTSCAITIGDFILDDRYDLGDLEFGNKTSVIDGIEERISRYRKLIVASRSDALEYVRRYDEDGNLNFDMPKRPADLEDELATKLQAEAKEDLELIHSYCNVLRLFEEKYLLEHEEVRKINEFKADLYTYAVSKDLINLLEKDMMNGPRHGLYIHIYEKFGTQGDKFSVALNPSEHPFIKGNNMISSLNNYHEVEEYELPDGYECIRTKTSLDDSYEYICNNRTFVGASKFKMIPILSDDDLKAIDNFKEIHFVIKDIENNEFIKLSKLKEPVQILVGKDALKEIANCTNPADVYLDSLKEYSLFFDGNKVGSIKTRLGNNELEFCNLVKGCPDDIKNAIKNIIHVYNKYYTTHDNYNHSIDTRENIYDEEANKESVKSKYESYIYHYEKEFPKDLLSKRTHSEADVKKIMNYYRVIMAFKTIGNPMDKESKPLDHDYKHMLIENMAGDGWSEGIIKRVAKSLSSRVESNENVKAIDDILKIKDIKKMINDNKKVRRNSKAQ